MIQYTAHHLSDEEIDLLNRGPTYIIPGQMHLFYTHRTLDTILNDQVLPLRKQLLQVFSKFSLDLARQQTFRRTLEQQFYASFSSSIPNTIRERAFYEQNLIESIQRKLIEDNLILRRTADNFNTFCLDHKDNFNELTQNEMETSNYFELIGSLDMNNVNSEQEYLTWVIQSMDNVLKEFKQKNLLQSDHFIKLELAKKTTNIKLPYLYFLPLTHQYRDMVLQSRLSSCRNAPVRTITLFLDRLLRPLYEKASQTTRLLNNHDFIQKIQSFAEQSDCLTLNTEFVTFELHNLYTRISHMDLVMALNDFLQKQLSNNRYQNLSIEAILELVKFSLKHHIFTYNGNIYRYTKGSPLNYTFTQLLFDIFVHQWQTILIRYIRLNNQFYGRYHNRGIFTWNKLNDDLPMCTKELNEQNADVQLTMSSGNQVHFMDAYLENDNGILRTRVYQNYTKQPFLLPYAAEYPRILHRQWFRFCLTRAILYCSSFDDFQDEYFKIELSFLANGYSLDFTKYLWKQFLKRFNPYNHVFVYNQLNYKPLRQQVFRHFNRKQMDLKRDFQQQQQQLVTRPTSMSFYYLYDWGNRVEFNRKFHELWSTIIMKDPQLARYDFKVFLRCKHCFSLHTLFVQLHQ